MYVDVLTMAGKSKNDLLSGTLDLLVLRVLDAGPRHGYSIARRIEQISEDVLAVQQGSLYPALHRLEDKALVEASWEIGESKKPAKVYRLTKAGKAQLEKETQSWVSVSAAINLVLSKA
ncbi:transcriptional regulator, PadR family, putative [Verrucomicrobiia bacterium DG1235]|nr:transcriptional regulator, PadR family, putative [Verrucomicrobiae bacterium DG1235]